jgi:hypothetical protein
LGRRGGEGADRPEDEDADEDDAVEPRGGVDVVLGASPRRGEPGLERRVGAARGVHVDVRRPAAEQRVGRGEEHGEGQVEPHRRGERRQDHPGRAGGRGDGGRRNGSSKALSPGELGPAGQRWKRQSGGYPAAHGS